MSIWRKPCSLDVRLLTNPVVGLIVLLCAVRIRDLVVFVVLVDEVQQNRAALEQPDSLAAELVRDGRDSPVWVDLQEPVFLFEWSASVLVALNILQSHLTFCVFLDKSMAVVCSTRQHNVTHRQRASAALTWYGRPSSSSRMDTLIPLGVPVVSSSKMLITGRNTHFSIRVGLDSQRWISASLAAILRCSSIFLSLAVIPWNC